MLKKLLDILTRRQTAFVILGYVTAGSCLLLRWTDLEFSHKLAYFLYLGLCLHQLEEYCFPGGFLWGLNTMLGTHDPMRWPGNRLSAGLCDIIATCVGLYLTLFRLDPFLLCCYAIIGLIELLVHTVMGFVLRSRLRSSGKSTIYVPGAATCWLIFAPLGIGSVYYLLSAQMLTVPEASRALLWSVLFLGAIVGLPTVLLQEKSSVYTYANLPGFYQKYLGKK